MNDLWNSACSYGQTLANASGTAADIADSVSKTASDLGFQHEYLGTASDVSSHLRQVKNMNANGILPTVAHSYVSIAIYAMFLTLGEMIFKNIFVRYTFVSNVFLIFAIQVTLGLVVSFTTRSMCSRRSIVSDWLAGQIVRTFTIDNLRSLFSKPSFMSQICTSIFFMSLFGSMHYIGFTFGTLSYGLLLFTSNRVLVQAFSL